jgi:hypothetical protein
MRRRLRERWPPANPAPGWRRGCHVSIASLVSRHSVAGSCPRMVTFVPSAQLLRPVRCRHGTWSGRRVRSGVVTRVGAVVARRTSVVTRVEAVVVAGPGSSLELERWLWLDPRRRVSWSGRRGRSGVVTLLERPVWLKAADVPHLGPSVQDVRRAPGRRVCGARSATPEPPSRPGRQVSMACSADCMHRCLLSLELLGRGRNLVELRRVFDRNSSRSQHVPRCGTVQVVRVERCCPSGC